MFQRNFFETCCVAQPVYAAERRENTFLLLKWDIIFLNFKMNWIFKCLWFVRKNLWTGATLDGPGSIYINILHYFFYYILNFFFIYIKFNDITICNAWWFFWRDFYLKLFLVFLYLAWDIIFLIHLFHLIQKNMLKLKIRFYKLNYLRIVSLFVRKKIHLTI